MRWFITKDRIRVAKIRIRIRIGVVKVRIRVMGARVRVRVHVARVTLPIWFAKPTLSFGLSCWDCLTMTLCSVRKWVTPRCSYLRT